MSIVKSFSVGNGDMFYIQHNSDSFTIIDCCMPDDERDAILNELRAESAGKNILRFISTHPDEDHIYGLEHLDDEFGFLSFYCVKNQVTKSIQSSDFIKYCAKRDSEHAFFLYQGVSRKWLNVSDDARGSAGVSVLWPDTENPDFQQALRDAECGGSPNNISTVIKYGVQDGANILWMGDLETEFMERIKDELSLPPVHILFAPHHGRASGSVPQELLEDLDPELLVIGEAPSQHLNYYRNYNTITQNSAGDITFECVESFVHIYVSSNTYSVDFLLDLGKSNSFGSYIGSLYMKQADS